MPGRSFNPANRYRYGFNGKENDDEVKGNGNSIDFGARIYDPRLGRFLSLDPMIKKTPNYSPYLFAGNKPITCIDKNGETEWDVINYRDNQGRIIKTQVRIVSSKNISTYATNNAIHTFDVTLNANNQVTNTVDQGWTGSALTPGLNGAIGMLQDNSWGRFTDPFSNRPRDICKARDYPNTTPMTDNVLFQPTNVWANRNMPIATFATPMVGANDAQTINDIATLSQNGSILGPISIQITGVALTAADRANPQFVANYNNLQTARAQAIMNALGNAGATNQIIILPLQTNPTTPSASITYQRVLPSADPISNPPVPTGGGVSSQ